MCAHLGSWAFGAWAGLVFSMGIWTVVESSLFVLSITCDSCETNPWRTRSICALLCIHKRWTLHFKIPFRLPLPSFSRHRQDFFSSTRALGHLDSLALAWRNTSPAPCGWKPEPAPAEKGRRTGSVFKQKIRIHYVRRNGCGQLTIMGKTMAAGDVLMTQRSTRHVSWVTVNRCTFLKGTCRR